MSDVFISYASSTADDAAKIAQTLRTSGYSVWRDDELPAHRVYAEVIQEQINAAKAVVVVWSNDGVKSQWVRAEANRGRQAGKLVQVQVDDCRLPLPFDQIHCAKLTSWSGDPNAAEWRSVLSAVAALAREESAPPVIGDREASTRRIVLQDKLPPRPGARPALVLPDRPSIAVLPFTSSAKGGEDDYLVDGISQDISAALSSWHWLFVISCDSSFAYRDCGVDVKRVGDELGARYILNGRVKRAGERVRIVAQLVNAEVGVSVWTDRYDRQLVDLLALQDEITQQIAAAVTPAMLQNEGLRSKHKRVGDFSALDCFYHGMWHLNKLSAENYTTALTYFREAIEQDPDLSLGHIGLARILHGGAVHQWSSQPLVDLREARAAAQTAIGLDALDAWAYFAASGASLYLGDHDTALAEAHKSVKLNPNFSLGLVRLGQVLIFSGRPEEAIGAIESGARLSPYDPQLWIMQESLALAYYHIHDYGSAISHAEAAMHQRFSATSTLLAASLAQAGNIHEAARVLPGLERVEPSTLPIIAPGYKNTSMAEHMRQGVRLARSAL